MLERRIRVLGGISWPWLWGRSGEIRRVHCPAEERRIPSGFIAGDLEISKAPRIDDGLTKNCRLRN